MINLENLSPEQVDVVDNLRTLGISDEDIAKSLNIDIEKSEEDGENDLEKSIEDQINEKQKELDELKTKIQKSETDNLFDEKKFDEKIDEIQKSLSDNFNSKVEGTNSLIKSLTDTIVSLKEDNERLVEGNEKILTEYSELKKSVDANNEMLDKIAEMSPGLKSIRSGANFTERFEKSTTEDGKEILSKSRNKSAISSKLVTKMADNDFVKSYGEDVSSFEISGRMSERLEKAIKDEFKVELVD